VSELKIDWLDSCPECDGSVLRPIMDLINGFIVVMKLHVLAVVKKVKSRQMVKLHG